MKQVSVKTSSRVTQRKQMLIIISSLSLSLSSMKWPQVTTPFQITQVHGCLCRVLYAIFIAHSLELGNGLPHVQAWKPRCVQMTYLGSVFPRRIQ